MRIAVAMSGGVDSSVAALLLAREGAEVIGLSMHLWNHDRDGSGSAEGRCCTLDDLNTARRAAETVGIPHYILNLEDRFSEAVVKPFIEGYLRGETPIPCTVCNTEVKFKTLLERSVALGCEAVATGHYARVETDSATGESRLLRARDLSKDQSYFLYDLTSRQLSRARFPLGDMEKAEVRRIARDAGLPNWDKPDSQEVCFVPPGGGPSQFIRDEAASFGIQLPSMSAARPGPITSASGEVLGEHEGTFGFTVGQRKGLGLSAPAPLYVLEVHPAESRVVVGPVDALMSTDVMLGNVSFTAENPPAGPRRVLARIRYRHTEQPALLEPLETPFVRGGQARLVFETPVRAAAPGQSAIFFDIDRPELVLGGGIILRQPAP
ncbi:MAG: tRNA 2-thiouridine(34) synthase MnmA [Thermoanaerobaculia bacterium]